MSNKRREDIAEVVEDRLCHDEGQRRFAACAKPRRSVLVERQGAAHDARPLAVVVGDDRPDVLCHRIVLERGVRRDDVDLVAVSAEDPQLRIHDEDAVDVGGLRGAAEQLADRHHVLG